MNHFSKTPAFMALLKDMVYGGVRVTVRELNAAHIGRKTSSRIAVANA